MNIKRRVFWLIIILTMSMICTCRITEKESAAFQINVIPENMDAISGQQCVLLITAQDVETGDGAGEPVRISAFLRGSEIDAQPTSIGQDQVAEVTVVPSQANPGDTLVVEIVGRRYGQVESQNVSIVVVDGDDQIGPTAGPMRDRFAIWLEGNHPELGITQNTTWIGTLVTPHILIVANYLFFPMNGKWD